MDRCHTASAAAASSTPNPVTALAVKMAIARSPSVMLMMDHAVTPAAARSTLGAAVSPGTASANAAATGTSAVTASAVARPGERPLLSRAPNIAAAARPLTVYKPSSSSVAIRCTTDSAVATRINPMRAAVAARRMRSMPHGFSRAAEKITAASAMSSTMRGAGGPVGTGCSASRSPSTTPTVPSVASRLNGAPPIGARLNGSGASAVSSAGRTRRCTAGRISRSGNSAGRATSVNRPPSSAAASTATRTIGITALSGIGFPFFRRNRGSKRGQGTMGRRAERR